VIGDRTGGAMPGKYEKTLAEIERLRPDFAVTVGDMIEGYSEDTTEVKRQWEEYLGLAGALSMPIYFTPGNHDITYDSMMPLYRCYLGEPHHSFDVRGVHFVVLDNGRYAVADALPREQLDWLVSDLEQHAGAAFTFVLMHVPFWREGVAKGKSDLLHEIFVKHGVDAVFTGHDHEYYSGRYDGVIYTAVGASGAGLEPGISGLEHHFVWVTVNGSGPAIAPVRMGGVLAWDEVTVDDVLRAGQIRGEALDLGRVFVGAGQAVPETSVKVAVKNVHAALPVMSSIKWEVPLGWTVTPAEVPVDLAAAASQIFEFKVAAAGCLYPVPRLSVVYPYAEGKTFNLERMLPVVRTAYAYKAGRPPRIDGELTDDAWKNPVMDFFAPDGSARTTDPGMFYFAWDSKNLYVGAKCTEADMASLVAKCAERDCPVFAEDCIGLFLEPQTADGPVYQIYFSAAGAVFDQRIEVANGFSTSADPKWNGAYKVKTSKGHDYWAVEAAIPLAEIEAEAKAGRQWALNFRRKQRRLDTAADWQVPISYDPAVYGLLEFK
jgi:predicted phosphodiesterase